MWILFVMGALAAPPLPTWTYADTKDADEEDLEEVDLRQAVEPVGTVVFEPVGRPHAWESSSTLAVSIAGEEGLFYYLQSTARGDGFVAHWRQGPYLAADESFVIDLALPDDLQTAMASGGAIGLSTKVLTTDLNGDFLSQNGLRRTSVRIEDGRPLRTALIHRADIDGEEPTSEEPRL